MFAMPLPAPALARALRGRARLLACAMAAMHGLNPVWAQSAIQANGPTPAAAATAKAAFGQGGRLAPPPTANTPPRGLWAQGEVFVDDKGQQLTLASLSGHPTVVAMEYTDCRFVCSINWRTLVQIQDQADGLKQDLQFVIISLNPEVDTPELWQEYRRVRKLDRANWHFLITDRANTNRIAAWLGVRWWYYESHIMHDLRILRFDGSGSLKHVLENLDTPVEDFLVH